MINTENKNLDMARRLAQCAAQAGGRVYYVGGFVRDAVMGKACKDVDVEVHGLAPGQLENILDSLGERMVMGESFGIYGLRHYDLDIAMPRCESKTGRGHRDFDVSVDPFLGTQKAAMRRDFTINAMMQDVLTGEILDHYHGKPDLEHGVIRHVNAQTFAEDPLRVLRAAQFAARFGFDVAPETVSLCSGMDLSALASERIMEEVSKALLKAGKPSVFFSVLRSMGQLGVWFPEVEMLTRMPDVLSGGEDAYTHAMRLLDAAAELRDQAVYPLGLMLSSLCLGFSRIRGASADASEAGPSDEPAMRFIGRISTEIRLKRYLGSMMLLGGQPQALVAQGAETAAYMELYDASVQPDDLLLLARAAACADDMPDAQGADTILHSMLLLYRSRMQQPGVTGGDLIAAGLAPGKLMGEALAFAHRQKLAGLNRDQTLKRTIERFVPGLPG